MDGAIAGLAHNGCNGVEPANLLPPHDGTGCGCNSHERDEKMKTLREPGRGLLALSDGFQMGWDGDGMGGRGEGVGEGVSKVVGWGGGG